MGAIPTDSGVIPKRIRECREIKLDIGTAEVHVHVTGTTKHNQGKVIQKKETKTIYYVKLHLRFFTINFRFVFKLHSSFLEFQGISIRLNVFAFHLEPELEVCCILTEVPEVRIQRTMKPLVIKNFFGGNFSYHWVTLRAILNPPAPTETPLMVVSSCGGKAIIDK